MASAAWQIASSLIAAVLIAGASVYDFRRNPHGYSQKWRMRRWINWFSMGLAYAACYMARYNMSVINNPETLDTIGITTEDFGEVISTGFWWYAVSLLVSSWFGDWIGGRITILFGAFSAGVCNVVFGIMFFNGLASKSTLFAFVLINYASQAIALTVHTKVAAAWYSKEERGTFGGLFGVMPSCGYYMAFAINGVLVETSWPLAFVIPGSFLLACGVLLVFVLDAQPAQPTYLGSKSSAEETVPDGDEPLLSDVAISDDESTGNQPPDQAKPPTPAKSAFEKVKAFLVLLRPLLTVKYAISCGTMCCIGFLRETLLTWFTPFLDVRFGIGPGSPWYTSIGTLIMVFGSLGGFLCGYISDRFFASDRFPAAMIFLGTSVPVMLGVYFVPIGPVSAVLVGFSCLWLFGAFQSMNFTNAMDIGGPEMASTATGFLVFFQYLGAGSGSVSMALIIERHGFLAWALMLAFGATASTLLIGCFLYKQWLDKRRTLKASPSGPEHEMRPMR
eukprot:TRINITY_DN673_c1_g1_i1.p1 TRINITY_DN673_c1_g1~~TRINITY_DN673_c1_g1_i1.p1  ORF type:complete len:505 (-),score=141.98 TRINITY_DN673_c1_g1_i1:264-1778(-)